MFCYTQLNSNKISFWVLLALLARGGNQMPALKLCKSHLNIMKSTNSSSKKGSMGQKKYRLFCHKTYPPLWPKVPKGDKSSKTLTYEIYKIL